MDNTRQTSAKSAHMLDADLDRLALAAERHGAHFLAAALRDRRDRLDESIAAAAYRAAKP